MAARRPASEDEDITEEGIRASDKVTYRDREEHIREMNELLQELRVILPGVQVLFAFLLTRVRGR